MTADQSNNKLRSWIMTAFAVPTSLSVLAKLDERLDFKPLLERVILNFSIVSKFFWAKIDEFLRIDFLHSIHHQLTFISIMAGVLIKFYASRRKIDDEFRATQSAIEALCQSVVAYIFVFDNAFDEYGEKLIATCFYTIHLFGLNIPHRFKTEGYQAAYFMHALVILGLAMVMSYDEYNSGAPIAKSVSDFIALLILFVLNLYIKPWSMLFTRITVFSIGIYILDYLAGTLIPDLNHLLDRIGA